jgi:hypothetical protein
LYVILLIVLKANCNINAVQNDYTIFHFTYLQILNTKFNRKNITYNFRKDLFVTNFGEHFLVPKIRQLGVLTPFLLFRAKSLKPFLARWKIFYKQKERSSLSQILPPHRVEFNYIYIIQQIVYVVNIYL